MDNSKYIRTVHGLGYLGEGPYKVTESPYKKTEAYKKWEYMIRRCTNPTDEYKYRSYNVCTVDPIWHNFQNFAEWYYNNIYDFPDEQLVLDKDIIFETNTRYGPDRCLLIPKRMNLLFVSEYSSRIRELPTGLRYASKNKQSFQVYCSVMGKCKVLGTYRDMNEALIVYYNARIDNIRWIQDIYRNRIPDMIIYYLDRRIMFLEERIMQLSPEKISLIY